jgi:sec-independent protein translocase protein TatB
VFLLILDSLGSVELLFIVIMALVFFGPRKLPQISRTLGKNLAEFRKASEDFKRTWEREVALEEYKMDPDRASLESYEDNSIMSAPEGPEMNAAEEPEAFQEPAPEAVASEQEVAGQSISNTLEPPPLSAETLETTNNTQLEPPRKQDWL